LPKNSLVNIKTLFNSAKNLTKAGADFLKIENNPQLINKLSTKNYKVFGHIGYTPQTDSRPTKKGINIQESEDLIKQALEIQEAGAVGIFLELVDAKTSKIITQKLQIPTIGIGSGKDTSGQVLVLYDLIGLYPDFKPSFVKTQEDFQTRIKTAVNKFIEDINLM
jgi:3-methyl-2-oxobutanoate hydroxymethyltransferase